MSNRVSKGIRRPWMPTGHQVLLMRAALSERELAIEAWNQWKSIVDFERIDDGSSGLPHCLSEPRRSRSERSRAHARPPDLSSDVAR